MLASQETFQPDGFGKWAPPAAGPFYLLPLFPVRTLLLKRLVCKG